MRGHCMTVTEGSQQTSLYQSKGAVDKANGPTCPGSESRELMWVHVSEGEG